MPQDTTEVIPTDQKSDQKSLCDMFIAFAGNTIGDEGFFPFYGMSQGSDRKVELAAITTPLLCYQWFISKIASDLSEEVVFAIDRYRVDNERSKSITLDDFLTVVYYKRGSGIAVGVIEYVPKTRLMNPVDWNNQAWVEAVKQEILSVGEAMKNNRQLRD
jgi:hypothetical protein